MPDVDDESLAHNRCHIGSVVRAKEESETDLDGSINGTVLMDKSVKHHLEHQWADWKFKRTDDSNFANYQDERRAAYFNLQKLFCWL